MEQAREAGKQLLGTLSSRDRFRLIDFASDVDTFREEMVFATRENIAAAERYLDGLRAEGSTNISGALDEALSVPAESGRLPVVLFVTDGAPTVGERDPERIAQRAAIRARPAARVHVRRRRRLERGVARAARAGRARHRALRATERIGRARGWHRRVAPDESRRHRSSRPRRGRAALEDASERSLRHLRWAGSGRSRSLLRGAGRSWCASRANRPMGACRWTTEAELPENDRENAFVARLWATQRVGYLSAETPTRRRVAGDRRRDSHAGREVRDSDRADVVSRARAWSGRRRGRARRRARERR